MVTKKLFYIYSGKRLTHLFSVSTDIETLESCKNGKCLELFHALHFLSNLFYLGKQMTTILLFI